MRERRERNRQRRETARQEDKEENKEEEKDLRVVESHKADVLSVGKSAFEMIRASHYSSVHLIVSPCLSASISAS